MDDYNEEPSSSDDSSDASSDPSDSNRTEPSTDEDSPRTIGLRRQSERKEPIRRSEPSTGPKSL